MPEFFNPPEDAGTVLDTFVIANWSRFTPPELPDRYKLNGVMMLVSLKADDTFIDGDWQTDRGLVAVISERLVGDPGEINRMIFYIVGGALGQLG